MQEVLRNKKDKFLIIIIFYNNQYLKLHYFLEKKIYNFRKNTKDH